MLWLHYRVFNNNLEGEMIMDIAEKTRTLEFVGLSISLVALLASLLIFCRFRSLRNTRTRIHKNLFVAMVVQVLIRLMLYIDLAIFRRKPHGVQRGIGNTPVLCEATYVLLEYVKTAMFMWMFIEGLFLHNIVTVTIFQEASYYRIYRFIGWGCPVLMTLVWATIMAFYYHPKSKKAVKAAVVLLPLLGITNILFIIDAPLDNVNRFAVWSYSTHFLRSFQGLFIATLYCFLNGEVRLVLNKTIAAYLSSRGGDMQNKRQSPFNSCQPPQITSMGKCEKINIILFLARIF
ncbi:PDF receptor [Camponotus floridanus]|uniref:PDF receptor n=1 Tax=Camponotus floridanus TaxID=104421 RepID=E2AIX3_CAMFO|nr:PDF receptor [Camponotus floridanus]